MPLTQFAPLIVVLSLVAILYIALVALAQRDLKKLIAYSSVAHMGFVTLGMFIPLVLPRAPARTSFWRSAWAAAWCR